MGERGMTPTQRAVLEAMRAGAILQCCILDSMWSLEVQVPLGIRYQRVNRRTAIAVRDSGLVVEAPYEFLMRRYAAAPTPNQEGPNG